MSENKLIKVKLGKLKSLQMHIYSTGFSRYVFSNSRRNLAPLAPRRRKRTGERATTQVVRSTLMETSMTMRMRRKTRDSRMTDQQTSLSI